MNDIVYQITISYDVIDSSLFFYNPRYDSSTLFLTDFETNDFITFVLHNMCNRA